MVQLSSFNYSLILLTHLPKIIENLISDGCKIYGDDNCVSVDKRIHNASEDDWYTEYLDSKISVKSVKISITITHIQKYDLVIPIVYRK